MDCFGKSEGIDGDKLKENELNSTLGMFFLDFSEVLEIILNSLNFLLDDSWLEKAKNELGETEDERSTKLTQLAERIVADTEIPNARRDDAFLLRFLRAKKFDVDKSFRMVCKAEFGSVRLHFFFTKSRLF